eukprot:CAMPEP_0196570932 /NCGR_PEP_ID=MMETSP1081-20130531/1094_1 /TAXON_ID=36882 /ORGANISM="Pyramimonas amylifera, Strain CCMP720" /LENGTH=287 /DNA_ID=CAMNT_0041887635 /DNA_START=405 /DNA_END=1268 /DNA_ORIENTATION=-
MVTAYDYPSAVHVERAGVDVLLVGDSVAMVVHGHDSTLPVTLDHMIMHFQAVTRGANRPLIVADLPFGSYEESPELAVQSAVRILKESRVDCVKMEGGGPKRVAAAHALCQAGVAVMGHVGLTPQSISALGGFRPQGRTAKGAVQVLEHALALQEAGCFAMVLECVPAAVSKAVTAALTIPTIGIGAGPHCSGQVLVYHDLLGMMQHPHYKAVTPKFSKQFVEVGPLIAEGLERFCQEVEQKSFPGPAHTPYKMKPQEIQDFLDLLQKCGHVDVAEKVSETFPYVTE